ncbi:MAG: hypothetical protein ABIH99_01220 [Candidatus Micrarchaeota archaeon]
MAKGTYRSEREIKHSAVNKSIRKGNGNHYWDAFKFAPLLVETMRKDHSSQPQADSTKNKKEKNTHTLFPHAKLYALGFMNAKVFLVGAMRDLRRLHNLQAKLNNYSRRHEHSQNSEKIKKEIEKTEAKIDVFINHLEDEGLKLPALFGKHLLSEKSAFKKLEVISETLCKLTRTFIICDGYSLCIRLSGLFHAVESHVNIMDDITTEEIADMLCGKTKPASVLYEEIYDSKSNISEGRFILQTTSSVYEMHVNEHRTERVILVAVLSPEAPNTFYLKSFYSASSRLVSPTSAPESIKGVLRSRTYAYWFPPSTENHKEQKTIPTS